MKTGETTNYIFKSDHPLVNAAILEDCKNREEAITRVKQHIENGEWELLKPFLDMENLEESIDNKIEQATS